MSDQNNTVSRFMERMCAAQNMYNDERFGECLEMFQEVAVDIRSCKSFPNDDQKNTFLRLVEKFIRLLKENISAEEIIDNSKRNTSSPEPPADPDVWSRPSPPSTTVNRFTSKKPPVNSTNNRPSTKPSNSIQSGYGSVDKSEKSDKPVQELLPPNKAGEIFDASMYDPHIVNAVRSTMELYTEKNGIEDTVIGMEDVKQVLREAITLPLLIPQIFKDIRSPWKAMCLCGPPGTGKTLIARSIASQSNTSYFTVSSTDLSSKWRGDSEKIVRLLFELARFYAPSIIFIDEVDTLGGQRGAAGEHEASRRVKAEFLTQMDGTRTKFDERRVFVIAATNLPWEIDEALRRRFEKRIYVPLPDHNGRKQLFENSMKNTAVAEDVDYDNLAKRTEGYSGADVVSVCRDAAYNVIRRLIIPGQSKEELSTVLNDISNEPVTVQDFEAALSSSNSSVSPDTMQKCKDWCDVFGRT